MKLLKETLLDYSIRIFLLLSYFKDIIYKPLADFNKHSYIRYSIYTINNIKYTSTTRAISTR